MKASQRQFLCSVDGLPDYYATFSGAEVSAETTKVYDGGKTRPDVLAGPSETSNIVLSRPYDPERDQPLIDRLQPLVGKWVTTVTKQPTDADFTGIGAPSTYPESMLVRVTTPEADASSADASTYELEFATPGPA